MATKGDPRRLNNFVHLMTTNQLSSYQNNLPDVVKDNLQNELNNRRMNELARDKNQLQKPAQSDALNFEKASRLYNDLTSETCKELKLTDAERKRKRRRRRNKALSWTFATLGFPLWLLYYCLREPPPYGADLDEELAQDFCTPCFYRGHSGPEH